MKAPLLALAASFLMASCATVTLPPGTATPSGPSTIPSTALDLGDYRRASESGVLSAFEREISGRYRAGLTLSAVGADLRRNEFNCAASSAATGRGDPPDQICRRTITNAGCTHTFQVHLFDESGNARLARTRALYDRRCGDDGLLGGPG